MAVRDPHRRMRCAPDRSAAEHRLQPLLVPTTRPYPAQQRARNAVYGVLMLWVWVCAVCGVVAHRCGGVVEARNVVSLALF